MAGATELRWARRVEQHKIRRLYALDAEGIVDAELIDEVGYAMYARCESIRTVTEAHSGRPACPRCRTVLTHSWRKDESIVCDCGWQATWGQYLKSYQGKQLHGGGAFPAFAEFLERWPRADNPRDRLLLIDALLHACHANADFGATRPAAVNLIEGKMNEVSRFLDELAYGDLSTPGTAANRDEWRRKGDESRLGSWTTRGQPR
ncbi:MAG: hypothetical protein IIC89_04270 [Chloroflexi bacterium]|nr:hypothetical protein [Chloroflexota bacterium]